MKYKIEFQYADGADKRPFDEVYLVIESDKLSDIEIPNVGDYVRIEHVDFIPSGEHIEGKVRSRFFNYVKISEDGDSYCVINVVVEATDDDFSMILKM